MAERQGTPGIGDFSQKSEGVVAVQSFMKSHEQESAHAASQENALPKNTPPEKTMDDVTEEISRLTSDIESVQQAPELTYEDSLAKVDVTLPEAEAIIDAMMVQGEFRKTYKLTSKYSVTFKSRKMEDQNRALNVIESKNPKYPSTVGNIVAEYNLAASIVRFRDIDFADDMSMMDRVKWVRNLPDTIASLLALKLSAFDRMLLTVLDEGSIENF